MVIFHVNQGKPVPLDFQPPMIPILNILMGHAKPRPLTKWHQIINIVTSN